MSTFFLTSERGNNYRLIGGNVVRKAFVSFLVLVFLVIFGSSASSAITIGFKAVSQPVDLGAQVNAALVISGLGDGTAPSLSTFDITIVFDPSILAYNDVIYGDPVLGDQLGSGSFRQTNTTPNTGAVELIELSLDAAADLNDFQVSNFTLAMLTFDTLAPGTSPLEITTYVLGDTLGDPIVPDTVENGSVDVRASAVPEPSVLLLLAGGFATLGLSGRKRTSAKSGA